MSSAGLLNGLILNGTIRYTFAGCVAISAQAQAIGHEPTRVVVPESRAQAEAASDSVATRLAFVSGSAVAACDAPKSARRLARQSCCRSSGARLTGIATHARECVAK